MTSTAEKQEETIPHTFSLTVQVAEFWINYVTQCSDLFLTSYAGYWLRGVEHDNERGWLVWEDDEKCRHGKEPQSKEALAAWRSGAELPPHWFRIDRSTALRAWEEGVKRWGVGWYEDADAASYDIVLQLALLGEERYG